MSFFFVPDRRSVLGFTSVILGVLAVGTATLLALEMTMSFQLQQTIDNSRHLLSSFQAAARAVDTYRVRTGGLPERLTHLGDGGGYDISVIDPAKVGFPACCGAGVSALGTPPKGSYVLEAWRGGWWEYFAPWSGVSTLTLKPDDFAFSGKLALDFAILLFVTACLACSSVLVWKKVNQRQPTA